MMDTQLVMYDEDYRRILAVINRLVRDANAKALFVVDKNGQLIAEAGEISGIDTTSLASLMTVFGPGVRGFMFDSFSNRDAAIYFPGAPFALAGLLTACAVVIIARVIGRNAVTA